MFLHKYEVNFYSLFREKLCEYNLPYSSQSTQAGRYVMVVTAEGAVIKFDGLEDISVTLPATFTPNSGNNHDISGLCGNMDGDISTDFIDYIHKKRSTAQEFASLYQTDAGSCKESLKMSDLFYNPQDNAELIYQYAETMCDVINTDAFKPCHSKIPPDQYKIICMQDVVNCNFDLRSDCMCNSLSLYARVCHNYGVEVSWRKPDLCRK